MNNYRNTAVELPHSTHSECALLGALINHPAYIPDVVNLITAPGVFYDPQNAAVYHEIMLMHNSGEVVDLTTLCARGNLRKMGLYLVELTQMTGTGTNYLSYAQKLVELYMKRQQYQAAQTLAHRALSDEDVGTTQEWMAQSCEQIMGVIAGANGPKHVRDVIAETLRELEDRAAAYNNGQAVGVPCGLLDLDTATGGLKGGQLVVLAGRPAMGKSAVMLHFARSAAVAGVPVVVFSLEMQGRELGGRILVGQSNVDANSFKTGGVSHNDWQQLNGACGVIEKLPLQISDNTNMTLQKIRAQCTRLKSKGQCGLVIIDYLQLLMSGAKGAKGAASTREREVADITRGAKIMAGELDVPVVMLSQLSRNVEQRPDKTPQLSDLRESGAIEQDADIVMFIHRPVMYGQSEIADTKWGTIPADGVGVLTIAKQRNGRTGQIYFSHSPSLNSINDYPSPARGSAAVPY